MKHLMSDCALLYHTSKSKFVFQNSLKDWEDIDSDDGLECESPGVEDQDAEDAEAGESPLPGAFPITDCLFCSHHSSSLVKNVAHMTKVHSFFIPDIEYLSDLKGLIKYLGKYNYLAFDEERYF